MPLAFYLIQSQQKHAMENDNSGLIPRQNKGSKLDTAHEIKAGNDREAKRLFALAASRLLDVNCWDKLCGPASAVFHLTDDHGKEIAGPAKIGDHFKIDVPGPGPAAGEGYDWVKIEAMDDQRDPDSSDESLTIRVRPATSPENANPDTAISNYRCWTVHTR